MARNRKGIHVIARKTVLLQQVLGIVQMPPDVGVGDDTGRQSKYERKNDKGENHGKGNDRAVPAPPVQAICGGWCFFYGAKRLNGWLFNIVSCMHRHDPQTYSKQFRCQDSSAGEAILLPANRPLIRRADDTVLPGNILTSSIVAGSSPHPTVVPYPSQRCYLQGSSRKATL